MSDSNNSFDELFGSSEEEQTQKKVFIATFSMLAKLASIDGEVSKNEVQIIDRFMKDALELTPERRKYAIHVFNTSRRDDNDFEHYAKQYAALMAEKPKMKEWMLDVLLRVSLVDKEYSGGERHLIERATELFDISKKRFNEIQAKYISSSAKKTTNSNSTEGESEAAKKNPYAVLKVSADASDDEVTAAYRKLSVEYGPSRIIELGLPEEFVQLAEKLFARIQESYKQIKSEREIE